MTITRLISLFTVYSPHCQLGVYFAGGNACPFTHESYSCLDTQVLRLRVFWIELVGRRDLRRTMAAGRFPLSGFWGYRLGDRKVKVLWET